MVSCLVYTISNSIVSDAIIVEGWKTPRAGRAAADVSVTWIPPVTPVTVTLLATVCKSPPWAVRAVFKAVVKALRSDFAVLTFAFILASSEAVVVMV